MFGMNIQGFDAQGKPSGNQQQAGMNFMGMNTDMKMSGFDKDGKPIPGQEQKAEMNFMGMNIKMNSSGFDKDGNPIPGQQQSAGMDLGGMMNFSGMEKMMGNLGNNFGANFK